MSGNPWLQAKQPASPAEAVEPSLWQPSTPAMNGETLQRNVTILYPHGFHLRTVAEFVRLASQFDCDVVVWKGDQGVNGKSTLELLLLTAEQGEELRIETSGAQARAALDALVDLINTPMPEDAEDQPPPPKG